MISKLNQLHKNHITALLFAMSLFCMAISLTRFIITDSKLFLFLNWNLFLAFIPWLISTVIIYKQTNNKRAILLLFVSWLVLFPNSPYILTDLFHLRRVSNVPIWFDLVVILSFAWTALMFGFISLMNLETLLKNHFTDKAISILIFIFMFVASFGVYLGRYQRWNSWDLVSNPMGLFGDIINRFTNPLQHPRTWGVTLLIGLLLNMMYFSIKFIKNKKELA